MEKYGGERMVCLVDEKKFSVEEHQRVRAGKEARHLELMQTFPSLVLFFFFSFCYAKGVSATAL